MQYNSSDLIDSDKYFDYIMSKEDQCDMLRDHIDTVQMQVKKLNIVDNQYSLYYYKKSIVLIDKDYRTP